MPPKKIRVSYRLQNEESVFQVAIPTESTVANFIEIVLEKKKLQNSSIVSVTCHLDDKIISNDQLISNYVSKSSVFILDIIQDSLENQSEQINSSIPNQLNTNETNTVSQSEVINPNSSQQSPSLTQLSNPPQKTHPMPIPHEQNIINHQSNEEKKIAPNQQSIQISKNLLNNQNIANYKFEKIESIAPGNDQTHQYTASLPNQHHQTSTNKFLVFTTANSSSMLRGNIVSISVTDSYETVYGKLLTHINPLLNSSTELTLDIYLPGGPIFKTGTIQEYRSLFTPEIHENKLYVIVSSKIDNAILDKKYPQLCNVSNETFQKMYSPLVKSTLFGFTQISCILGYIYHAGSKSITFIESIAKFTRFVPLILSLYRISERENVTGHDILASAGSLHTFFRYILPETVSSENIFNYACKVSCWMTTMPDLPTLPITTIDTEKSDLSTLTAWCKFHQQPKIVYLWTPDTNNTQYEGAQLLPPEDPTVIDNIFSTHVTFKPYSPLSLRLLYSASICKGKNGYLLYTLPTALKDDKQTNFVDLLNPLTGYTIHYDPELLARDIGEDDSSQLIDPEQVRQIIYVCFDESISMSANIYGYNPDQTPPAECSRFVLATQFLTSLSCRMYGYRFPVIQGLISFNNNITRRCPLSPLLPTFEDAIKIITPDGSSRLWDAISEAGNDLLEFNRGKKKYPNATSRILVISDGEDMGSKECPWNVATRLKKAGIIVDSVVISAEEDSWGPLCAFCHFTGGLAFNPSSPEEGLALFEDEAFLDISVRKITKPDSKPITETMFVSKSKIANFDVEVVNKLFSDAKKPQPLTTPRVYCYINRTQILPDIRLKRILKELEIASSWPDDEVVVYTLKNHFDVWRVFMKGPDDTLYSKKWWYLLVTFPDMYPDIPPLIRFISVPFHINISHEGRICMNAITKFYQVSQHVMDLISLVKGLLLEPDYKSPISIQNYKLYLDNPEEFKRIIRRTTESIAKNDYHEWIGGQQINDQVPEDYNIPPSECLNSLKMSMCGVPSAHMVQASSGAMYDKNDLKELLLSSAHPICVFTGKPLTDDVDELD